MIPLAATLLAAGASLTLQQAQAEARARAPDTALLEARLRGAQELARDARRIFRENPSVSVDYAPGALVGRPDESAIGVGARLPLDFSGSWGPRAQAGAATERRAEHEREDGLRALDEAVAVAVADLALAQRQVAHADRTVNLVAIAAEAARREMKVGTGNQLDLDAAELDLADGRSSSAEAQGDLDKAQAGLGRLLGRASSSDLAVADVEEQKRAVLVDIDARVAADPRVRAAAEEAESARAELSMNERLIWPIITLGVDYTRRRNDIPAGSFSGAPGLTSNWTDAELGFTASLPLPLFDRRSQERAQSSARVLAAEGRLGVLRAEVRQELQNSGAELRAAARKVAELRGTEEMLERDFQLLGQALRAGALDAVQRAQAVRRLVEMQRKVDLGTHDLRVARARWNRRWSD